MPCFAASEDPLDDADRARDLVTPVARHELAERGADVPRHAPRQRERLARRLVQRQPLAGEDEAESIRALVEARRRRRQRHVGAVADDDDGQRRPSDPGSAARCPLARPAGRRSTRCGRRPEAHRAAGDRSVTCSTVVVAFPADVMKRKVKSTSASTMFAAGPAAIAATRFQVGARQYAVGPSASSMSSRLLRADAATCGDSSRLVDAAPADTRTRVAGRVVVAGGERAPEPARCAGERRRLGERPSETRVDVHRRRPVHAGDLHEAAQRDRAEPVLDPVPRRLPDRRREPDVEPAAAACRARARR